MTMKSAKHRKAFRRPLNRSQQMARIRSKDTGPELALRRALYAAGLRYRLHAKELPGKPDVVFRRHKLAIYVHGCFWHGHSNCRRARVPASRQDYWLPKLTRNKARDQENRAALASLGWAVFTIWECEILNREMRDAYVNAIAAIVRRK